VRMQQLIGDLLAFSRAGGSEQSLQPLEAQEILDGALVNLQGAIAASGAKVTHDKLPTVLGDGSQLRQLFQNLVGNALKFQGTEAPSIHVGVRRRGKEWLFSVKDNGIGIESVHFDRIFILFQRLHARAEFSGTGIGLALCKRIVERHGGRIWVESEQSQGSTFWFTLRSPR